MNLLKQYLISLLSTAITLIALAALVYFKNPRSNINRTYAFFKVSAFLWCFGEGLLIIAPTKEAAIFWNRICNLGIFFIGTAYIHFVFTFLGITKEKTPRIAIICSYIFSFLSTILLFFDAFLPPPIKKFSLNYFIQPGYIIYPVFVILWFCQIIYALCYLTKAYIASSEPLRNQLKYLLVGAFIGFTGGSGNYFLTFNIEIYPINPFGNYGVLAYSVITTYAMLRHRLLDINIVIRRTIIYSSLITILTITYLLVVLLAERFSSHFFGYTTLPMTIVTASIIAMVFIPLKNKIQYIVDRLFFKGTLDSLSEERELMQQELARSERMKAVATLAAGMAHEIKNPLTAIKTFTEHLEEKKDDPAFVEKFKRIVGGEVDKINDLVHQLLDFAKPNPLKLSSVNINTLLDDTLALLSDNLLKRRISVNKKYSTLAFLQADENQLKQAFLNLCLNAIEAMPNGGELTVETQNLDNNLGIQILIRDTGKGIPKKELPHIFDPFYSTKDTGTGLGLSITHEIIKKHNGTITVDSQDGRGTTMTVEIYGAP